MKKFLCGILISLSITGSTVTYAFTDVPYEHPDSTAISYLRSYGIIEGYPDGTFRPDSLINRVEFLKIILEGTNVPLDVESATGFTDISEQEWYYPYLQKAKYEGWIEGYPDNTFRPEQPINKVEALKILGEVQNWDRLAREQVPEAPFKDTYRFSWYSPYAYFAKENNLLSEETDYLYPGAEVSRGYMAQLVYRTITEDVIRYEPQKTLEEQIEQAKRVETPDNYALIESDYFTNVRLDKPIPNTFYKNEIYVLTGEIEGINNPETIFAFFSEDTNGTNSYTHYMGTVSRSYFEIPLSFPEAGTFYMGIIPNRSGQSKLAEIQVLDGIPREGNESNSDIPVNMQVKFENDSTIASWDSSKNNVYRVYFIQENVFHSYFVRDEKSLKVFYNSFWRFKEGDIKLRAYGARADSLYPVSLSSNWAKSKDYIFEGITHHFRLIDYAAISHSEFPEIIESPKSINFTGVAHSPILKEGAVITPDGMIDFFDIKSPDSTIDTYGNEIIPANSPFMVEYTPTSSGTHILEINNLGGAAVLNAPLYIGSAIPIIPDFFDLQNPFETTESLNLEEARLELLDYINAERINHGLKSVFIDEDLNKLAQSHTDDMYKRNFFAHINPDGETPNDRRLKMGIETRVGENLAHAPTLYFAHKALMRSAIHRENILNDTWDKVGIGITLDDSGYLLVAEEFSHIPWTKNDLENFENEIVNKINSSRTSPLKMNSTLREIARNWSYDMIDKNFFSFSSPSGINLIDVVKNSGVTSDGNAYILKYGSVDTFYKNLIQDSDILSEKWNQIGIGIQSDASSNLYLTVIYTS